MSTNPLKQSFAGQQQPQEADPHQDEGQQEWSFDHLDVNYGKPGYAFGEPGYLNYHKWVIANRGFELVKCIADEPDNKFDNQVWIIKEIDSELHFAFKVCSLHYYNRVLFDETIESMYKEMDTIGQLNHQNVIVFIESFELEDPCTGFPYGFLCSVLELMDGTLQSLQDGYPNKVFTEEKAKEWFRQIASAVDYLHNGIDNMWLAHLAIRPVNILYRKVNADLDQYVFKLTDFEESIIYGKGEVDAMPDWNNYRFNGYTAPEMRFELGHGKPTKPMDIFSLGQTLLSSLVGRVVVDRANYVKLVWGEITIDTLTPVQKEICEVLSQDVALLVVLCVSITVEDRPTIEDILDNIWLMD